MAEILKEDLSSCKVACMRKFLLDIGAQYSLKNKAAYVDRLSRYKEIFEFPWRQDQRKVIETFVKYEYKYYCIDALWGSGKTSMLIGTLIHAICNKLFAPNEVMFISFNICIKNEIKRKLKTFGIGSKVSVRTFDSLIYEISKNTGYKYVDLPNYEGKRKHVYQLCSDGNVSYVPPFQPKVIFIDECQDLEKSTFNVFQLFYKNSKIVFTGDIFQSIQKEPRESVLWYLINSKLDGCYNMHMTETPRVPKKVLATLKTALTSYYPEFAEQIASWTSSNNHSSYDIEWRTLDSYSSIFDELKDFCTEHSAEESMILTFSSSITVRGQLGDISRLRRFLLTEGLKINHNHKRQEPENYFLTTANSSKGLERDYVICFLTFPLEKAFIHLSDDVVVNLVTVALTRAKKKVIFYVPKYSDKYSRVLRLFDACPKPTARIRDDDKGLDEFSIQNYLDMETSVTQLMRQSIIKYDTRIKITENYAKGYKFEKIFPDNFDYRKVPKLVMEEEKQFVGILVENLITSSWTRQYPVLRDTVDNISKNPMYAHCISRIKGLLKQYSKHSGKPVSASRQFDVIYMYSQAHVAISDKILMKLSEPTLNGLRDYWRYFEPKCADLRPREAKIKIQYNLRMPWITGVADAIGSSTEKIDNEDEKEEITVYEIKASSDNDWKDDALLQAIIYSLMTGKLWSKIVLINPFRNERAFYSYNTYEKIKNGDDKVTRNKNMLQLRDAVVNDVLMYNLNCMFAKRRKTKDSNCEKINVVDNLFVNVQNCSATIMRMISPIKAELIYHKFFQVVEQKQQTLQEMKKSKKISKKKPQMSYNRKRMKESTIDMDDVVHDVQEILKNSMYKGKVVYSTDSLENLTFENQLVKFAVSIEGLYTPDENKQYKLNMKNSMHCLMLSMAKFADDNAFV